MEEARVSYTRSIQEEPGGRYNLFTIRGDSFDEFQTAFVDAFGDAALETFLALIRIGATFPGTTLPPVQGSGNRALDITNGATVEPAPPAEPRQNLRPTGGLSVQSIAQSLAQFAICPTCAGPMSKWVAGKEADPTKKYNGFFSCPNKWAAKSGETTPSGSTYHA